LGGLLEATDGLRDRRRPDWLARASPIVALALLGGGGWYSAGLLGPGAGPRVDAPTARGTAYSTATFATLALGPTPTPRPPTATVSTATSPVTATPVATTGALPASLPATLRALPGRSSAALLDLDAPDGAASDDPAMVMPAGALIMLPLAGAAYERVATGAWRADTTFTLTAADKVGGTGSLQHRPTGTTLTLDDLIARMLTKGDNTAANLVLARLGGVAAVNDYASRLGLRTTTMRRPLDDTAARTTGIANTTTAGDLARLLLLLDRGRVASPAHSARLERARGDPGWLCSALPPGAGAAHATGQWPDFRAPRGSCASAAAATRWPSWSRTATGRRWSEGSPMWPPRRIGRWQHAEVGGGEQTSRHATGRSARLGDIPASRERGHLRPIAPPARGTRRGGS
jgi:beta-lactamase class A